MGDKQAFDQVVVLLDRELRSIAHAHLARTYGNNTLSTTAVVNEAYLKLVKSDGQAVDNRAHFLAIAAKTMRNILIDYARKRTADKRGGGRKHIDIDDTNVAVESQAEFLIQLDQMLTQLEADNPRLVQVFECRFFAGMDEKDTAHTLGLSLRTAQRDWQKVRAFLQVQMSQ